MSLSFILSRAGIGTLEQAYAWRICRWILGRRFSSSGVVVIGSSSSINYFFLEIREAA